MRCVIVAVGLLLMLGKQSFAADISTKAPYFYYPEFNWTGTYVGFGGGAAGGNLHGALGTLNFGINFQTYQQFVLGVEADLSLATLTGSNCIGCAYEARWLATARGRVGYTFGPALVFVTGGLATGSIKANGLGGASTTNTRIGYAIGAGVEYDLRQNWSFRADYLHVDLGNFNCGSCGLATQQFRASSEIARIGLIYRFFQEAVEEYNVLGPPIRPPPF